MLYEFYVLIKHGNFTYLDVLNMPIYERRAFIDMLMEENEKVKQHRERDSKKK
jgi:hypothetical protein